MDPPKRITQELGRIGNRYAWLDRCMMDWGDGKPRETFVPGIPDGSMILPILENGNILLVRQFRLFTLGWSQEIPGGIVDDGETGEQAARRELLEETGFAARELRHLITFYPSVNIRHRCHVYAALGLTAAQRTPESDEGDMELREFSADALWRMLLAGEITDSPTVIALLLAKEKGLLKINGTK